MTLTDQLDSIGRTLFDHETDTTNFVQSDSFEYDNQIVRNGRTGPIGSCPWTRPWRSDSSNLCLWKLSKCRTCQMWACWSRSQTVRIVEYKGLYEGVQNIPLAESELVPDLETAPIGQIPACPFWTPKRYVSEPSWKLTSQTVSNNIYRVHFHPTDVSDRANGHQPRSHGVNTGPKSPASLPRRPHWPKGTGYSPIATTWGPRDRQRPHSATRGPGYRTRPHKATRGQGDR